MTNLGEVLVEAVDVAVSSAGQILLAPISFTLGKGQVLAVVGENGAGKTTLLRALTGVIAVSDGTLLVGGEAVEDRRPTFRSKVAAQIGLPPFARNLTLLEHMALVGASWGSDVATASDKGMSTLSRFGIEKLESRFPHELSSGQTQLFALALTWMRPFEVLVLDEPEQRLDVDRLSMLGDIINETVSEGATVVMASHSESLVRHVATQRVSVGRAE
ncbi:ABC-type multidrug transport system ATPase subunit [Paenarthrobacter nicotinovorans]|uniref:ABC-type multidrug transport system ATPase subunit n=1 Tax=Paenarthrobacter nicotinovorans TaxID=29320 RepID=A0ABT9TN62_PAENI|nr:ATP-binding cassette domain-containing protein [Paenarthrobacter nicotinovorans]MDQ0103111.1 ABC-type multidrug transport system ATPase subunit [Paenarthrobacter nicotinovorans]